LNDHIRENALMSSEPTQPSGRATIVDVAAAAGVSRQTVSNVLNSPERVARPTRERVTREIERLGFTPHAAAQQLRRRRAHAYGFDVDPSGIGGMGPVLSEFLVSLTSAAPSHGSHLVTFSSRAGSVVQDYEQLLATGLVDGFVIADTQPGDPRPEWLLKRNVPFVAFGRVWDRPELDRWVDVDGRAGMQLGVSHLIGQGYESIGFLGWPAGSPVGDDRRRGWLAGLADAGLADDPMAEEAAQDLGAATAAAGRLLDRLGPARGSIARGSIAVLCASDTFALGAHRAARARDLEPGRDVGIVGFDDSDIAVALELTSLRQPLAEVASHAWRLFESEQSGQDSSVLLTPTIVSRASTSRRRLEAVTTHP
jgi:DNA-binding LacI/PurR family transcriptional regulator